MSIVYSTYVSMEWDEFKRAAGRNPSDSALCRFYREVGFSTGVQWASKLRFNALFLYRFRPIRHYFLDPGVADFCRDAVREFSEDYCKQLPECPPVKQPAIDGSGVGVFWPFAWKSDGRPHAPVIGQQPLETGGGFAVHFPDAEKQRSLVCIPGYRTSARDFPVGQRRYYCAITDGQACMLIQPGIRRWFDNDYSNHMAKTILGLSLYLDAFPDAVAASQEPQPMSFDEGCHDGEHGRGPWYTVGRNEIVEEEHTHGVNPHWRRGHYRLLKSERYVNMRGKAVYVRGAFVKGTPLDVLDDAPPFDPAERVTA